MGSRLQVSSGVFFLGVLWLLLLPPAWGMGAILAASVHELGHLLAILACGGEVLDFTIGCDGAKMETTPMAAGREILCALAGPLGSFSLLAIGNHFPEAALCGMVQGLYNLLPIYPLDGGRVIRCLFPAAVCWGIEVFSVTLFSGIALWISLRSGQAGLIFLLSLWIPMIRRKLTCKQTAKAVQ